MRSKPIFLLLIGLVMATPAQAADEKQLDVLFIGNSYTARHNLADVVKTMAEAGNPGLTMNVSTVIYGGRRLVDHWRLGTQHFVNGHAVTAEEIKETIAALEIMLANDPDDRYAQSAIGKQKALLADPESHRKKWDIVVLQSYRDDLKGGADSLYAQYAPKFAELIHAQGARVILYETTPNTQNAEARPKRPIRRR